ncbi:hypothetical protein L249_1864 [Ophiocordyceps polyrhachis-furcata BCC 54312]|uniref:Uncharacterized protein n=1 Tax=Ophiocordyceps polyrhachis-furcata BCC 54312 TaxID=1330021 RepID=A0A367LS05_9HYPO|nr:hypothetical protein L249_1864 [Ophiocordyceps polyrhachis-furcata BCC 54312]
MTGRRLAIVTAAVVANHVRRMLVAPWLGQALWRHPVEAMKLARWSPHGYLEASLADVSWPAVALWLCQQVILSELLSQAAARSAKPSTNSSLKVNCHRRRQGKADAYRVLLLLAALTLAESSYAETCWAVALIGSTARLLFYNGQPERDFAQRLLGANPARAALLACLVLRWFRTVALPHATWLAASLRSLKVVLPAAACCVGASTVHLVQHSNRYFLVIEMSDMLVTWGWSVILWALATAHR